MIQVFDTHRLSYRNAYIRAFDKSAPTKPIQFKDVDGTDVGYIVYTNAQGYLCYGNDRQPLTCLKLGKSAIVQVSLDGGTNWAIEWEITDTEADVVRTNDVGSLYYYDVNGDVRQWDPLSGSAALPDYLLKADYDSWNEDTIRITDETCSITPTRWTKNIVFTSAATASYIVIHMDNTRDGQQFAIFSETGRRITFLGTDSDFVLHVKDNSCTILGVYQHGGYKYCYTKIIQTQDNPDRTERHCATQYNTNDPTPVYTAQDLGFALDEGIVDSPVYIRYESTTAVTVTSLEFRLPEPVFAGRAQIILDLEFNQNTTLDIYVKLGQNTRVKVRAAGDGAISSIVIPIGIISYYNSGSVRHYMLEKQALWS